MRKNQVSEGFLKYINLLRELEHYGLYEKLLMKIKRPGISKDVVC